jgi:N-acetylglucosamine-6-phosphate deacetylase
MGLDKKNGKIAPGYTAQFLVLDDQLNLKEVISG